MVKVKIPIRYRTVKVKGRCYKKHKINHFPVDTLIKRGLTRGKFRFEVSSSSSGTLWGWLILGEDDD